MTVYSRVVLLSSAVTVYFTGWEKSCVLPLAGDILAPSETLMTGASDERFVPAFITALTVFSPISALPICPGTVNSRISASWLFSSSTITAAWYSCLVIPSSAVTVYFTGWEKSCASPLAGDTLAPAEISISGVRAVTSVPNGTFTVIVIFS